MACKSHSRGVGRNQMNPPLNFVVALGIDGGGNAKGADVLLMSLFGLGFIKSIKAAVAWISARYKSDLMWSSSDF